MMNIQTISTREMFRNHTSVVAQIKKTGQPAILVNQKQPQIALISLDDFKELQEAKQRKTMKNLLNLAGIVPKGSGLPKDLAEKHSQYAWD